MVGQTASEILKYYKDLGINVSGLACGCAVKVDLKDVVYPALRKIKPKLKKMGLTISSREDADIFRRTKKIEICRKVFSLNAPMIDEFDFVPDRAIVVFSVEQRNAIDPDIFARKLLSVYKELARKVSGLIVGKGHSIIGARSPEHEVAVFDFISVKGEELDGYTLANNCTVRILDPTEKPSSPLQVEAILSNSLNDLFALGVTENIRIYPLFDMPNEELLAESKNVINNFCREHGFHLQGNEPLGFGEILMGATVIGETLKELPTFKDRLRKGDKILIHRAIGDLAPINLYLASLIYGEEYAASLGFSFKEIEEAKNAALNTMRKPNVKVAEVISKYCPEFGEKFNDSEHIKETTDLSGPGIYVFKEIAEAAKVNIRIEKLPVRNKEVVKVAVKEFLIPDGTAGTNGAIAIIASEEVIENIYRDLRKEGYLPEIIGTVLGKGEGRVLIPESVRELISSESLLREYEVIGQKDG